MIRDVGVNISVEVHGASRLAFQVGVAHPEAYRTEEHLAVTYEGRDQPFRTVGAPHGGRIWLVDAEPGAIDLEYRARLDGAAPPPPPDISDELLYTRPSRYCESDRMIGFASRLFHDITDPTDVLAAISSWVGTQLDYVSGSSGPTDGAVDTLLAGRGVCRDFAHLAVALLRAKGLPARLVAVYAPGLDPMDFHAVAEAFIAGTWYVIDSTLLAPRSSLVRIGTGRDAADTAFLTNDGGHITLHGLTVTASVDGVLPPDDVLALAELT